MLKTIFNAKPKQATSVRPQSGVSLRFPRLRAALALAGMGLSVGTVASDAAQSVPACDSPQAQFGNFRVKTTLYYPEDEGVSADFFTELQRHFSDKQQPLTMQVAHPDNQAAIRGAYLSHHIRHLHITEQNSFVSHLTALGVTFAQLKPDAVKVDRISIDTAKQQLSTSDIVPAEQPERLVGWFAQPENEDIFSHWQEAGSAIVTFFGQVNGKEQVIGRITLPPDALANYTDILTQQVNTLWQDASEGKCTPYSHRKAASDTDCFFTTASVHCLGLQDDCWELTTLRQFRDNYLLTQDAGKQLVAEYYAMAPAIVADIQQQPDAKARWLKVYWSGVLPSAVLARLGLHKAALAWYRRLVRQLSV